VDRALGQGPLLHAVALRRENGSTPLQAAWDPAASCPGRHRAHV